MPDQRETEVLFCRCKRFSMMVEDGKVTKLNVEPDGTGLTCSLADKITQ